MTRYRTVVRHRSGIPFHAYDGHFVSTALDIADDYMWAPYVAVEWQDNHGGWRVVVSRECR